ncbi:MAG: hypothetical protein ACN4GZ_11345 [Acidimicrobiales bacterium]
MPKWTKFAVGWAIATTVALAFSWGAVAQVRNRVIQPSVEIPTTAALATTTAPPPEVTTSTPRVVTLEPELADTTTSTTATATTEGTQETTAPTPTTGPTTTSPTTTTAGPTTTSTTTTTLPPATTTTSTTAPPQTQTSSYTLVGGVVTISHAPGVVNFVSAIPQPGFSTDPRETGPDRVRIRFESQDHTSDFRAEWEGGELKITQNESGED